MTAIVAQNRSSTILQIGGVLTIAGNGNGYVTRRAMPLGSGPATTTQFTGPTLTFGPYDEIATFTISCDQGAMDYDVTVPVRSTANNFAIKYTKTVNENGVTTVYVPAGSILNIIGDGVATLFDKSGVQSPISYTGGSLVVDAVSRNRIFDVFCYRGSITLSTAWFTGFVSLIASGTPLRGFQITATAVNLNLNGTWQSRSSANGNWSDIVLANPFTVGSGSGGTGSYGFDYRYKASGYFSNVIGPTGISDMSTASGSSYATRNQDIISVNTNGVGSNVGYVRGVDYATQLNFYRDDFGSNMKVSWKLKANVGPLNGVFCYAHTRRNRYTDDTAANAYSVGVVQSNLSTMPFTWDLTIDPTSVANFSFLNEYFTSDVNNASTFAVNGSGGTLNDELGFFPIIAASARSYFEANPTIAYPDYVDENGKSWRVRSKAGPTIIKSGGRFVVMYPIDGPRLSGSLRRDRWTNWLIAQNITKGAHFMNGVASGLEIISSATDNIGIVSGKFMPSETDYPWSGVSAAAYTFDPDVDAWFARFSNLPGIEVRKAVDAFISGLKSASLFTKLDAIYIPRAAGKLDMRREFKSATYDIIDRTGTADFKVTRGLGYLGTGYGGTQFNPATVAGQFAQNSAFMFAYVEEDVGSVSATVIGNATARIGRNAAGTSLSHQLNNASAVFAGNYGVDGHSLRRVAGATPGGTNGSAGYQVKRASSTAAVSDQTATSTALTSAEFEIGRGGSGTVYGSAYLSVIAFGAGLTNTEVDTFNSLVLTLRSSLTNAGL